MSHRCNIPGIPPQTDEVYQAIERLNRSRGFMGQDDLQLAERGIWSLAAQIRERHTKMGMVRNDREATSGPAIREYSSAELAAALGN